MAYSIVTYAQDLQALLDKSRASIDVHTEAIPCNVLFGGKLQTTRKYDTHKKKWAKSFDISGGINTEKPVSPNNDFVSVVLGGKANSEDLTRVAVGCIDLDVPNEDGTNRVSDLLELLPSLNGTYIEPSTSIGKAHVWFVVTSEQAAQFTAYRATSNLTLESSNDFVASVPGVDIITNGAVFSGAVLNHQINPKALELQKYLDNNKFTYPTRRKSVVTKAQLRTVYVNGLPGDEDTIIKTLSDADFEYMLPYLKKQSTISKVNGKLMPYRDNGVLASLIRQFLHNGIDTPAVVIKRIANTLIYTSNSTSGLLSVRGHKYIPENYQVRIPNTPIQVGSKIYNIIPPMPVIDGNYEWYNNLMTKVAVIDSLQVEERKEFLHLWLMEYVIYFDPARADTVEFFRKAWNYHDEDIPYRAPHGYTDCVTTDDIKLITNPKSGIEWYKTLIALPEPGVSALPLEDKTLIVHTEINGLKRYVLMKNFNLLQDYVTHQDRYNFMTRTSILERITTAKRQVAMHDDELGSDNIDAYTDKTIIPERKNMLERVHDTLEIKFSRDIRSMSLTQFDVSDGTRGKYIDFNTHKLLPAEQVEVDDTIFQGGKDMLYQPVPRMRHNPIYKALRYTLLPKTEAYYIVGGHKLELALVLELHIAYTLYHSKTPLGWGIMYSNEQGTGKTSINAIFKNLLFKDLAMPIQQTQLVGRFLPELDTVKLITMEEILNKKQLIRKRVDYDSYIEMLKMASDVTGVPMSREIKGGDIVEMQVDAFFLATSNNDPDSTEGERRAIVFPARKYPNNADGTNDAVLNKNILDKQDINSEIPREYATYLRSLYEFTLDNVHIQSMLYKEKPELTRLEEDDEGEIVEVQDTFKPIMANTHIYDAVTIILGGDLALLANYRKISDESEASGDGFTDINTNKEINDTIAKYITKDNKILRPYPGLYTKTRRGVTLPQDFVRDMIFIAQGRHVEDIRGIQAKLVNVQDIKEVKALAKFMGTISIPRYTAELRERLGYADGKADMLKINLKHARK